MSEELTVYQAQPVEPATATSLVQLAIERGVDPAVLERLVALQERVTERSARAEFFDSLARFQERCPEIPRRHRASIVTKSGAQFGYTYAALEDISKHIRPYLRELGLAYSWTVDLKDSTLLVTCTLRHIDGHAEASSFPVPIDKAGRMSEAQTHGAALTYGRRQSLIAVLGLTTADEDTDAPAGRAEPAEKITEQEAADLDALIEEVGADRVKFCRYHKIGLVSELPKAKLAAAIKQLESRRRA